jgi:hypothetical protein
METQTTTQNANVIAEITKRISRLEKDVAKMQQDLNANFQHYFTWHSKDMFVAHVQLEYLKFTYSNGVDAGLKLMKRFTSQSYNIRSSSSCELTAASSTWKFVAVLDLIEFVEEAVAHHA